MQHTRLNQSPKPPGNTRSVSNYMLRIPNELHIKYVTSRLKNPVRYAFYGEKTTPHVPMRFFSCDQHIFYSIEKRPNLPLVSTIYGCIALRLAPHAPHNEKPRQAKLGGVFEFLRGCRGNCGGDEGFESPSRETGDNLGSNRAQSNFFQLCRPLVCLST